MSLQKNSKKVVAAALSRLERIKRETAFDPYNPESQPTKAQQEVLDDFGKIRFQWIVAGNQGGKSQTCSRIVAWVLTDTHPTWTKPAEWRDEPLLVLVVGRTGKQIEESLLPKIRGYLEPGTYKEVRVGNSIQRLELTNGNRVVFQSVENPNIARERLQSYVAHLVWVDEMPPTMGIINELQLRVQARSGYFLASFTPLTVNAEIARLVDASNPPLSKKYRFSMLDNPIYADPKRRADILESMQNLPESIRNTRLYGDWSQHDSLVYYFLYEGMVEQPQGYSSLWRHVESVDPATQSALGLTIWAEDPNTGIWYCIVARYIRGIYVPTEIIKTVREITSRYNIIRRVADPEASWYINQAASMGIHYVPVFKKNNRKNELIKKLQQCLGSRIRISPDCEDLISEFQECRWSESDRDKIVNSSSYHLLDSAQYFCDEIPKEDKDTIRATSWEDWLWQANEKRKINRETKQKQEEAKIQRKSTVRRSGSWRQMQ